MTSDMQAAFELGSGFTLAGLYLLIGTVLASALFLWAAWTIVGQYLVWAHDKGGSVLSVLTAVLLACGIVTVIVNFL